MAEYIEREASCEDCSHYPVCEDKLFGSNHKNCRHFQNKADVVEVRHGEWEKDPIAIRGVGEIYDYRCSVCTARAHKGEYGNYDYITDYCPNCGAKMDGKGEGG